MPTYCFRCPVCEEVVETRSLNELDRPLHEHYDHTVVLRRDYRAERVGFGGVAAIKAEREGKLAGADLILPTAKHFERPDDPTGERGMKKWMETHGPRPSNKNPRWPTRSERQGV